MDKQYVKHYILATYGNTSALDYRANAMAELLSRYDLLSERIINALAKNGIEHPERLITYTFRMLGDHHDDMFNRRELVNVDILALKADINSFPWSDYGWVQAFQPLIDIAGYTIVEIDLEYQSFGPEVSANLEFIQPCFRIYEKGRPEFVKGGFTSAHDREGGETGDDVHEGIFSACGRLIKDNVPTVIAIGSALTTLLVVWKTTSDMAHDLEEKSQMANDILHHIEDTIDDAIELPQVVKVEFPDDSEVIGTGRRSW